MNDSLVVNDKSMASYLERVSKEIADFIEIINQLEIEKEKIMWECENYEIMSERYQQMIDEYMAYTDHMKKILDYLNGTIERFDETTIEIKKEYQAVENEIDKGMINYE